MEKFPDYFAEVLRNIAKKRKLNLAQDTHFAGNDFELIWVEDNIRKRLNYNLEHAFISTVFYKDIFARSKSFINIFLGNQIKSIEWENLENLPINESKEFYEKILDEQVLFAKTHNKSLINKKVIKNK